MDIIRAIDIKTAGRPRRPARRVTTARHDRTVRRAKTIRNAINALSATIARRVTTAALSILVAATAAACGGGGNTDVIIAGSTSIQPYAELLAEEFETRYPGHEIDVQGGGSSAGIAAVESDTADIGMSSRALKDGERDLWNVEIARDGLAVIINPDNPVQSLTMAQLRDIYAGGISGWSEVGGRDSKIHVISREEGSGTKSAFDDLVMQKAEIDPRAIIQDSNGAVIQLVAGDKNSIGFVSLGLINDSVKAARLDGIEASPENVLNGSYNLYRQFLFVTKSEPEGNVKLFIDYALSSEGRQKLIDEGLVPPEGAEGVKQ